MYVMRFKLFDNQKRVTGVLYCLWLVWFLNL